MSPSAFLLKSILCLLAFVASPMRGRALGGEVLRKTGLWRWGSGS